VATDFTHAASYPKLFLFLATFRCVYQNNKISPAKWITIFSLEVARDSTYVVTVPKLVLFLLANFGCIFIKMKFNHLNFHENKF
jgi:hypothetical protein